MMNIIFTITALVTFAAFSFLALGFISVYNERKVTPKFTKRTIIACCLFTIAGVTMFKLFQVQEGAYVVIAMFVSMMFLFPLNSKLKEAQ